MKALGIAMAALALLGGCASPPSDRVAAPALPTAVPTLTEAPATASRGPLQAPTRTGPRPPPATPLPPTLTPVATGASVRFSAWSPSGEWIAYWRADVHDPARALWYPAGILHLQKTRTGETCSHPEFATMEYGLPLAWQGFTGGQH